MLNGMPLRGPIGHPIADRFGAAGLVAEAPTIRHFIESTASDALMRTSTLDAELLSWTLRTAAASPRSTLRDGSRR
jgi:hypothetical protein